MNPMILQLVSLGILGLLGMSGHITMVRALRPRIEWWYARKLRRCVQVLKGVLEGPVAGPGATP
jgi:hypothetical protein